MNYSVVMAGGAGTRFWPVSRLSLPKQLLPIGGDESLLARAIGRVASLTPAARVMIVTGEAIAGRIAADFPDLPRANIVAEPLRRNTAPCAAAAAKLLLDRDPEAVLALLPADHLIAKEENFRATLGAAFAVAARSDEMITLGVTPHYPETGYGYIEMSDKLGAETGCAFHRVAAFHEKPDAEKAQQFLASGRFLWNAGIFVFRAAVFLRAVRATLPDLADAIEELDGRAAPEAIDAALAKIYPNLRGVSIDVGVMEKVRNLLVFPADIGWSDVGSWTALRDLHPADAHGNVGQGDFLAVGGANNTFFAQGGVAVALGVDELIIVHTPDATLVARRDDAQAVKRVYEEFEKRGWKKYL
jgi:mannose-1-phosphate guanylyltransferase